MLFNSSHFKLLYVILNRSHFYLNYVHTVGSYFSVRSSSTHQNQSADLQSKSDIWFLYSKSFYLKELLDKITTQLLCLCTSCKSITPSHDQNKLLSQSAALDTTNIIVFALFLNFQYIFVMIYQLLKYPNVEFIKNKNAKNVISWRQ